MIKEYTRVDFVPNPNGIDTPEIVEIKTQAIWRGYKPGVKIDINDLVPPMIGSKFPAYTINYNELYYEYIQGKYYNYGVLRMGGLTIMKDGRWAKIIID